MHGQSCGRCLELTDEENNLCPVCGSVVACADLNFELYEGEALGIVGESGSGKSTLLRLLYLIEEPDRGELHVQPYGSQNVFSLPPFEKRRIRDSLFGIVYQNPEEGLRMHVSAGGNVAERLMASGLLNFEKISSRTKKLFEELELPWERHTRPVKSFSGGMKQRVQIARALAGNPKVLLLDEPTGGLDLSVQAKTLDLIRRIFLRRGLCMVVVSHDIEVIRLLTDRVMVMKKGRVVEQGTTDQILEDPKHPYTQMLVNSRL
ncbi:MAG: ATP-binding cassette domain-containing protein [Aquificaceae bacterium]|nr:ATP-binding cassette domain-containing protein [Aquificaceae bacterium]